MPIMIKRVQSASMELAFFRRLDVPNLRKNPWNPAPRLLYVSQRGDKAVLCFERLWECDQFPMRTVGDVVDYVQQTLEVCPVASPCMIDLIFIISLGIGVILSS